MRLIKCFILFADISNQLKKMTAKVETRRSKSKRSCKRVNVIFVERMSSNSKWMKKKRKRRDHVKDDSNTLIFQW